ncbi:hypothetical protein LUZ60_007631 [Juncus effusus]|nr:hypothetical protein LUZ60_007631 [Juncus effusus]
MSIKEEEDQPLIPGLPDEVALDCLARVPYRIHTCLRHVCQRWRHLVATRALYSHRERIGLAEDLVFILHLTTKDDKTNSQTEDVFEFFPSIPPPVYSISSYNVKTCEWRREATRVPIWARCIVGSDGKLVVIGGWHPTTLQPIPDVWVMEASTRRWHKGKPMRIGRSLFACASDGKRVFVAGGHDDGKTALNMVEAYDAEKDEWVQHPDMLEERDDCIGAIVNGDTLCVMSGFHTDTQRQYETSGEWYDECTGEWTKEEGMWVIANIYGCCFKSNGKLYSLQKSQGGVSEFMGRGKDWRKVANTPELLGLSPRAVSVGTKGNEKVFVTGFSNNVLTICWLFDLKTGDWTLLNTPTGFDDFVCSVAAVRV